MDKIETIRSKFPDKVGLQNIPQGQKQKLDPKGTFLNARQKMKLKSIFGAHRQNHHLHSAI